MSVWFSQSRCCGKRSGEGLGLAMSKRERGKLLPLILEGSSGEREARTGRDLRPQPQQQDVSTDNSTWTRRSPALHRAGVGQDCTVMENVQKAQPPLEASILPEPSHFPIPLTPLFFFFRARSGRDVSALSCFALSSVQLLLGQGQVASSDVVTGAAHS